MQLLDYLAHHSEAKVQFHTSDMIMNIHSDALYLLEGNACSQMCGHFFMGWLPQDDDPIKINGAFHVSTNVIRFLWRPPQMRSLGLCSTIAKQVSFFVASLKIWGMYSPKPQCILTVPQQWASQTAR